MRVYVAGSRAEMRRASWAMDKLIAEGHSLVADWRGLGPSDAAYTMEHQIRALALVQRELKTADLLWWLVPPREALSWGSPWECGYAHALRVPIVSSGPAMEETMFSWCGWRFISDKAALRYILAAGRRK